MEKRTALIFYFSPFPSFFVFVSTPLRAEPRFVLILRNRNSSIFPHEDKLCRAR